MTDIAISEIERAAGSAVRTVLRNERYFSDLDAAAGDADFGVSPASGIRIVEREWDEIDRSSIGNFLLRISMTITRHVGGCSGPIRGTGFMRAAQRCAEAGLTIVRNCVGEYCTSLGMAGASLTLLRLDSELEDPLEAPAEIPIRIF